MEYLAPCARLPEGWVRNVRITVTPDGLIERVATGGAAADAQRLHGAVLPAMTNCHSHAFQRAMAGSAELRASGRDDFWSWREAMYRVAGAMSSQALYGVALQLYVEMLKAGYSTVAEFHYLLRTQDSGDEIFAGSIAALRRAATDAGIRLLLLPVLYQRGGFDDRPLTGAQQRFYLSTEAFGDLVQKLAQEQDKMFRVGMAIHSLRAVSETAMQTALTRFQSTNPGGPLHIHIAEQEAEVRDCVASTGQRPIDWLLDRFELDSSWCLVHAMHASPTELERLAETGATIGLCPTTEANLGDGVFPAEEWLGLGGRVAIGSDSNVSVSAVEELRLLEYSQRLVKKRRNVLATDANPHVGDRLWSAAVSGGARAVGVKPAGIVPGAPADLVVVDADHPQLSALRGAALTDAWVFSGSANVVRDVMVAGRWQVAAGKHARADNAGAAFRAAMEELSHVG